MGSTDQISVALVNFAADDQMPQLVSNYYAAPEAEDQEDNEDQDYSGDGNTNFTNSRLVLHEEDKMEFTGQKQNVSKLQTATGYMQYDPIDVAPIVITTGPGNIQNGAVNGNSRNCDDDQPLDISTDTGNGVPEGSGGDEPSALYEHCHAPMPSTSNVRAQRQLILACCVSVAFMVGEVVGGSLANSLAVMTDAAHLLSDFASFLISIFALWVARRPATTRMSFGYYRAEVLGAVISVLIIWIVTGILCYLAVLRVIDQSFTIDPNIMLITAGVGVSINIILIIILQLEGGHLHSHGGGGGGHQHLEEEEAEEGGEEDAEGRVVAKEKKNINVRAAFIHVIGDLIQSIGVLIAAGVIKANPAWKIADPICTFLFSILVLITTLTILRDALNVLMEGVPRNINYPRLKEDLVKLGGVKMAHNLHIWSLTTSRTAMAVHLAIEEDADSESILQQASGMVQKKYGIHFSTIQVERYHHAVMSSCTRCAAPC